MLIRTKSKRQKGSSGGGTSGESNLLMRVARCTSSITSTSGWYRDGKSLTYLFPVIECTPNLMVVEVSVGPDALKLARSSLGRIHRLQMRRKEVGKFAPSDMKVFHDKIEQCQKAQDEREGAHLVSTRSRDYYSLDNMVTALTVLWNGQGQRKDGRSFIEMFCISATHNMLLRDEELHQINFSDCFAVVTTQNRQPGAQQCVALTFKLKNNDRTSDANQKLYVSTLRHYDVTRCTFSAFAFYMFQIWQVRFTLLFFLII